MSGYLIDTDVLCEPQKQKPRVAVLEWLRKHEADLYTSSIVVGEIAWGIERLPKGRKRDELATWLREELIPRMDGRILRFDTRVALEWGALQAGLERAGKKMPWRDSAIASTARRHGLRIATHNTKDYKQAGVDLVNPFA